MLKTGCAIPMSKKATLKRVHFRISGCIPLQNLKKFGPYWNSHDVTICDSSIKSYAEWKYKIIISMMTIGSCGHTCAVLLKSCVFLKSKFALFVGNSHMICMLWKFLEFNTIVIFPNFLSNWVNLLGILTSCENLRAFERNASFWNSYLMPWRPIVWEHNYAQREFSRWEFSNENQTWGL